jgi:GAF domain-containing protein
MLTVRAFSASESSPVNEDERVTEAQPEHAQADPDVDSGTELARHLAGIATVMMTPDGSTSLPERILSLAIASMDSCDDAGLCGEGGLNTHSALTAAMAQLDALQTQVGHGPCLDALGGQDTVYVPDLLEDQTWPLFSPEAVRRGLRSALAYRLALGGETLGALQLYAHLPGAFNANERAQGLILATFAGLALGQAKAQEAEEARIENLETALSSREVIGQAQGILMERERITADQAFQLLRRSSQHLNRKLRVVAQDIVDTGAIPLEGNDPAGP